MRVTNLIIHILSEIILFQYCFLFLYSIQSLTITEILIALVVFSAFIFTLILGIILFRRPGSVSNKTYMKRELVSHSLSAASYGLLLLKTLSIIIRFASEGSDLSAKLNPLADVINLIGLALAVVGIIISVIAGTRKDKQTAIASVSLPITQGDPLKARPRFCPNCGRPTGTSGDFCSNCGTRLL